MKSQIIVDLLDPKTSTRIEIQQTEIWFSLKIPSLWTYSYLSPSIHSTLSKEEDHSKNYY